MEQINRYEILEEIAVGGMSSVYLAFDPNFQRRVVVKLMAPVAGLKVDFLERFRREAKIIAAIEHPAIVPVYDFGEEKGLAYIVMQYMAGGTLADKFVGGQHLSLTETVDILARICAALEVAHDAGIIHRDLKPGNILFDQFDNAYLGDFGLARMTKQTKTPLTLQEQSIGTPVYMSPEQIQGEAIDKRSDVYALGILLYEMLSGKPPYKGKSAAMTLVKQMSAPIPKLRQLRPEMPVSVEQLILNTLSRKKGERPASATEFFVRLSSIVENDPSASIYTSTENGASIDLGAASERDDSPQPTPSSMNHEAKNEPAQNDSWLLWGGMAALTLLLIGLLQLWSGSASSQPLPDGSATAGIAAGVETRTATITLSPLAATLTPIGVAEVAPSLVPSTEFSAEPTPIPANTAEPIEVIVPPDFVFPTVVTNYEAVIPTELVGNGTFDETIDLWWKIEENGGRHDQFFLDGMLCVNILDPGENWWDLSFGQIGIPLEGNTVYTLSFEASVNTARPITLKIGSNVPPFDAYYLQRQPLRSGLQRISLSFLQINADPAANLEFHLGEEEIGLICFDNISLTADRAAP